MLSCSHEFANIVTEKPRQGKHIFMVFECMALGTVKPEHNNLKTSLTKMFDKFEQLKLVLQCVTMCYNVLHGKIEVRGQDHPFLSILFGSCQS
jgi:hypothetical protein